MALKGSAVSIAAGIAKKALGLRLDPYGAYNFFVEIEGMLVGSFSEVSGLEITTETETIREGGVNDLEYKLPKQTTYSNIVLKSGLTAVDMLWNWYADVVQGKVKRKNGSIYVLDDSGIPLLWWNFYNAWPVQWNGPQLDASNSAVAIESLSLAHQGIKKSKIGQFYAAAAGAAHAAGK